MKEKADEDVGEREISPIVGGSVTQWDHYGNQHGCSSESKSINTM